MLHALIMAGGSGTRFWPASRRAAPKQVLALSGPQTMIQTTVSRLEGLVPAERILVMTSAALAQRIRRELPQLPRAAVVGEPCKRDTAPCIGLAALWLMRRDPEATMVVTPADHAIEPAAAFREAVNLAVRLVDQEPGRIVTFGIPPRYPAETFGYIERGAPLAAPGGGTTRVFSVVRFREKPAAAVARQYLETGAFYWNSGIFVWRAATICGALAHREPAMFAELEKIADASGRPDFEPIFAERFAAIRGTSIDYAVMEHARDVAVIEAPFEWDDVGSWQSLARLAGTDADGNTVVGRHLGIDTRGCVIRSGDEHLVATLGTKDLIIVHTSDVTLVARKDDEEAIRQLVAELESRGWTEYL